MILNCKNLSIFLFSLSFLRRLESIENNHFKLQIPVFCYQKPE